MADVFISYAREDQGFVRRLFVALREFGRETWVDWEGIPPSAVWMAEVRKAIEAGEAFVFVISPDSLASAVCREEVAHAASVNKRLIPILHREVGDTPAPEAVAERNWIFMRDDDGFNRGVEQLLEALAADPEWNEQHARLLVRAREWEQRGRVGSLLLRGDDLRGAEQWLATAAGHEPEPTAIHTELILASRRAAGRRQRVALGGVAFALVAALILSVFALAQRSAAVHQRERAEAEARTSRSRELAAEALGQIDVDPELGVLLALEAVRVEPTHEAEEAFRETMASSHVRASLTGHRNSVLDATYSPNGARVLTIGFDGMAMIWDSITGDRLAVLEGHTAPLTDGAFSPDGAFVATASEDGTARVWDGEDGTSLAILDGRDGVVSSLAFVSNGRLVTGGDDGTIRIWDVVAGGMGIATLRGHDGAVVDIASGGDGLIASAGEDGAGRLWDAGGRSIAVLRGHADDLTSVSFGPDGLLLSTSEDGTARLWSTPSGESLGVLEGHTDDVVAGAISPGGSLAATASLDGTARVWLVSTSSPLAVLTGHAGEGVVDVEFSEDGSRVVTAGVDGTARIWSSATGEPLEVLRGHSDDVTTANFDPSGASAVTASGDGTAKIWDARGQALAVFSGHRGWVWDASFDDPEERVTTAGRDGTARIWDATTGEQLSQLDVSDQPVYSAAILHDGVRLITSGQDGILRVWDLATGRLLLSLGDGSRPINAVNVTHDDALAITGSLDGTARLWDLATGDQITELVHPPLVNVSPTIFGVGENTVLTANGGGAQGLSEAPIWIWDISQDEPRILHELDGHEPGIKSLVLTEDGTRLLSAGGDPVARIWDVSTGELLVTLEGHSSFFATADISDDGTRVLTINDDGTARTWDGRTGEELQVLRPPAGRFVFGDLSADGRLVVIGESTGAVRVWDASSGRELAVFAGHSGQAFAAFNADATAVLTWGDDGTARIFSCELCRPLPELVELAQGRLTRGLSAEERAGFGL